MEKKVGLLIICIAWLAVVLVILADSYRTTLSGAGRVLRVMSGSMTPALNLTDMILVQPVSSVSDIFAAYETGDIICFHKPSNPDELIVHRAVEKTNGELRTKGDNNAHPDYWIVTNDELVGKVVEVNSLPLVIIANTLPLGGISIALVVAIVVLAAFIVSGRKTRETKLADVAHTPQTTPQMKTGFYR